MFQVFVKQVPVQLQINIFKTNHDIEFSSGKNETSYYLTLPIFKFEGGWVPVEFKPKRKRLWRYWKVGLECNGRQGDHFTSYVQSFKSSLALPKQKNTFLIPHPRIFWGFDHWACPNDWDPKQPKNKRMTMKTPSAKMERPWGLKHRKNTD